MSDDILTRIDEVMARNAARFDPFGDLQDGDRVDRVGDEMRWAPAEPPHESASAPGVGEGATGWDSFASVALGPDGGTVSYPASSTVTFQLADRQHPASPYLTREDITGQPDRVGDALRAEVLRQGLTECEVDGVPWEYRDGQWASSRMEVRHEGPWTVIDETHVWLPAPGPLLISDTEPSARLPWWKRLLP